MVMPISKLTPLENELLMEFFRCGDSGILYGNCAAAANAFATLCRRRLVAAAAMPKNMRRLGLLVGSAHTVHVARHIGDLNPAEVRVSLWKITPAGRTMVTRLLSQSRAREARLRAAWLKPASHRSKKSP